MKLGNIGDLAQSTMLRRDTARVKGDLDRLTREMTSGKAASLNAALKGQFGPLASISRGLSLNDATLASNATAARLASAQQVALGTVQDVVSAAGPDLLEAASTGNDVQRAVVVQKATEQLQQVLSALNTQVENKAVFAGAALDGPAMTDAETMLVNIEQALTAAVGPADAIARVTAWFNTPSGGFESVAYQGATDPMSDIAVASGETAQLDITAADPALRDTLRGLALGALMERGLFDGDAAAQGALMRDAGALLANAADDLTARRAGLGFTESRIEAARIRTEAETSGLEMARSALVDVDPYETALRLQEVQLQLETIYAVTARVSGLSLAQVLR